MRRPLCPYVIIYLVAAPLTCHTCYACMSVRVGPPALKRHVIWALPEVSEKEVREIEGEKPVMPQAEERKVYNLPV
jgi:hypothetical protein